MNHQENGIINSICTGFRSLSDEGREKLKRKLASIGVEVTYKELFKSPLSRYSYDNKDCVDFDLLYRLIDITKRSIRKNSYLAKILEGNDIKELVSYTKYSGEYQQYSPEQKILYDLAFTLIELYYLISVIKNLPVENDSEAAFNTYKKLVRSLKKYIVTPLGGLGITIYNGQEQSALDTIRNEFIEAEKPIATILNLKTLERIIWSPTRLSVLKQPFDKMIRSREDEPILKFFNALEDCVSNIEKTTNCNVCGKRFLKRGQKKQTTCTECLEKIDMLVGELENKGRIVKSETIIRGVKTKGRKYFINNYYRYIETCPEIVEWSLQLPPKEL